VKRVKKVEAKQKELRTRLRLYKKKADARPSQAGYLPPACQVVAAFPTVPSLLLNIRPTSAA
jgi:hypothetical protein